MIAHLGAYYPGVYAPRKAPGINKIMIKDYENIFFRHIFQISFISDYMTEIRVCKLSDLHHSLMQKV